ncbi:phosphatidylcholine and lysophosphatidylcholine phospholipase [Orbilia ellipsospora]|uniref:Lysophospholipase NTE1 n=1 Tax=Orbilia ellipsospora TaxID=2528407 RepID=A0AAV9XNN3_9PEZI
MASFSSSPSSTFAVGNITDSILPTTMSTAPPTQNLSVLGNFIYYGLWMFQILPWLTYWILSFTTYTVPALLFTLASTSFSITMNFTTLLAIALLFATLISYVVRYRYLNMYAHLPPEPPRKEPQIDLFTDEPEADDAKPGISSYLDEFLSAIKVFGYLERPIFHELTRHMQTRKLIAGETLLLEEEKGFCVVVDGLVQVFVKSTVNSTTGSSSDDDEEMGGGQGYQLLTEVKNGAPMSSLFTILSLFTEDVHLRHTEEDDARQAPTPPQHQDSFSSSVSGGDSRRGPRDFLHIQTGAQDSSFPQTNGTARQSLENPVLPKVPTFPMLADDFSEASSPYPQSSQPTTPGSGFPPRSAGGRPIRPRLYKTKSVHPDIIARATVDTTIAVIPAAAFKRLTRIYPKASAHIVSVILTRFLRVTFATARNYLGLTGEVLRAEKSMNNYTSYDLPNHLRGAALDRLKEKFATEKAIAKDEEELKGGMVLHSTTAAMRKRRRSTFSIQTRIDMASKLTSSGLPSPWITSTHPGDLFSNVPLHKPRSNSSSGHFSPQQEAPFGRGFTISVPSKIDSTISGLQHNNPLASENSSTLTLVNSRGSQMDNIPEEEDEFTFREAVLECMFKAIGLSTAKMEALKRPAPSVEASPRLVSYDAKRQKAVFNSFGHLDPFEDAETESVASTTISNNSMLGPGPSNLENMKDEVDIVFFPKGSVLVEEGERSPGLYYVIDGFLDITMAVEDEKSPGLMGNIASRKGSTVNLSTMLPALSRTSTGSSTKVPLPSATPQPKKPTRKSLFMVKPGGVAGYIGCISGSRSFVEIRAKTDVYVGFLPRSSFERIMDKHPVVLLTMAKRITSLLPRLMLHIDFALEWLQINAGQVLYREGEESDAIYIILNGRLRGIRGNPDDGDMQVVGEYGQGESVGELEVLTESTRPVTLHAIRDTEVARFPKTLFNSLALEHPGITIQISKIIATRMRSLVEDPLDRKDNAALGSTKTANKMNLRTVCILPVASGVPVTEFSNRLSTALQQIGVPNGAVTLNQAAILKHLGRHAFSRIGRLKLSQFLADQEEKYGMVLYVADTSVNARWTQTCITQADCILLVALADGNPGIGDYERYLVGMKTTARKELVLLHPERLVRPGLTRQWLKTRIWINGGHHHVQMSVNLKNVGEPVRVQRKRFGDSIQKRIKNLQDELSIYISRRSRQTVYPSEAPFKGDFHRLARRLCGKSVGLVLGGGGARGIAHVGVIRALEEEGIPIDLVGGTSIGSFVGALYARDADIVPVYGWVKKFSGRMASLWRLVLDLTYPAVSYTTGHEFNRGIFKTFGDSQIEDFWLEFYCNTTSISHSRMEIHTSGYAWRYVRASMSLAGLLPPLCDEGSMLLDGGYVDNLTVSHMKSLGADTIFAIDVGSMDDNTPQNYGDTLSGAWTLFNRWNPFSWTPNPPTLAEIQARLAYVSSVDALERAKTAPGCYYMRPPIDPYGTLDFGKFDEIYNVGYVYGKRFLRELSEVKGGLRVWGGDNGGEGGGGKGIRWRRAGRRASI